MAEHYRFETKRPNELDEREISGWNALLDVSDAYDSAFFSYAFACAAEAAGFDAWATLAWNEDDDLVGVFAFQKKQGIAGALGSGERVGGTMADYCGPLLNDKGRDSLTPDAFFAASGLKLFEVSHAPARPDGVREDIVADDGGPITRLPDGFDAWWTDFSKKRKSRATDLSRRMRKIEREVGVLHLELNADRSSMLLEEIIEEKRRQYQDRDATDVFRSEGNRALLHHLAKSEDPRCQLVVTTLHAGDTWAASHIGLRCRSAMHYWFPVYNENLKRSSPGRLLILEMLRAMPEDRLDLLDYGLGEGRTKMEFASEVRPFVKGTWGAAGIGGVVARSWQSLLWRLG